MKCARDYFFLEKPRTSFFTRLSICSFVSFLPKAGMSSPPSETVLISFASVLEDCHSASVKSRAMSCLPLGVLAVPSCPWHLTQYSRKSADGCCSPAAGLGEPEGP